MQVYADNAATAKISEHALSEMIKYYSDEYQNPSSLHAYGQAAADALTDARERIAKCLGCHPQGIIFTSGGSEADNQAIISAAKLGARKNKKHIISTAIAHHAVLHTLDALKKQGSEITLLPVSKEGLVTADQVLHAITNIPKTCNVVGLFCLVERKEWEGSTILNKNGVDVHRLLALDDSDIRAITEGKYVPREQNRNACFSAVSKRTKNN